MPLASMLILLTSYGAYHICIVTARLPVLESIKSVTINIRNNHSIKLNHEIFLGTWKHLGIYFYVNLISRQKK